MNERKQTIVSIILSLDFVKIQEVMNFYGYKNLGLYIDYLDNCYQDVCDLSELKDRILEDLFDEDF